MANERRNYTITIEDTTAIQLLGVIIFILKNIKSTKLAKLAS